MAQRASENKGHRPPLARILGVLAEGKTARDSTTPGIAADIALMRVALRNRKVLERAFQDLEKELGPEASQEDLEAAVKREGKA